MRLADAVDGVELVAIRKHAVISRDRASVMTGPKNRCCIPSVSMAAKAAARDAVLDHAGDDER